MLTKFQNDIIRALVCNRSENSYFAGSSVFNEARRRMSGDLDIFHPSSEECERAFRSDLVALEKAGFSVEVTKQCLAPFFAKGVIRAGDERTEVDWAFDSGYRFFPAQKHPKFGHVLHEYDLLVGKIFACASREAVRDYFDLCDAWERGLPVVECIFAAPACDPGYSPVDLLDSMSFLSRYRPEHFEQLDFGVKLNKKELADLCVHCKKQFVKMTQTAREAFKSMPFMEAGTLFLKKDTLKAFLPTLAELEQGDFIRNQGSNYAPTIIVEDDDDDSGPSP
jgi:hypothetical protein